MKSKLLLVVFIICNYYSVTAQFHNIGPAMDVNVYGNLVVQQSLVTPLGRPTPGQSNVLLYPGPTYIQTDDSSGRVVDHEDRTINYSPNVFGQLYVNPPENSDVEAIQIFFESIDLGEGDTLVIRSEAGAELMTVAKNTPLDGTFIFNTQGLKFEFKSNADISVGRGFSILWFRWYNHPLYDWRAGIPNGKSFIFDRTTGALSSGMLLRYQRPGIYASALGYQNIATGSYAQALGYFNTATGTGSIAAGMSSKASGSFAVALGGGKATDMHSTAFATGTATAIYSFAMGQNARASAFHSIAMGQETSAGGYHSLATGKYTSSPYFASVTLGHRNYTRGGSSTTWDPKDPILLVGNGWVKPSNSLELYKNGNMQLLGSLSQLSDKDLQKEPIRIEKSLERLSKIYGYRFYWLDTYADRGLQTGLMASEVKDGFPELVTENLKGEDAINYIGLIPHLIVAINELQQKISELKSEKKQADIAVCLCSDAPADRLSAFPNPAHQQMTVTIATETTGKGLLKLYDANGKMVRQMNISIQKGKNTISVSLPGLSAGNYELTAEWGQGMKKQVSIVKQ
jgi:hypothetical protein